MALTKYERGTSFPVSVTFKSGSTAVDPISGAYLDVYKADGTSLIAGVSGSHYGTGLFKYFISTTSTDPLGVYYSEWYGKVDMGSRFGDQPRKYRTEFQIAKFD